MRICYSPVRAVRLRSILMTRFHAAWPCCWPASAGRAARQFEFSRQRYYQLRALYLAGGAAALAPEVPGPKTDYRRTDEVIRLAIRLRFLDPDATAAVVAQKLRQLGHAISTRSVERIVADYGLQKKTPHAGSVQA